MSMAPLDRCSQADSADAAEKALADAEQQYGKDSPGVLPALQSLAAVYHRQGMLAATESLFRRQVDVLSREKGSTKQPLLAALNCLALVLRAESKLDDAESVYLKALALTEQDKDGLNTYAQQLCALSAIYMKKNELSQAEDLLKKAAVSYHDAVDERNCYLRLCRIALALTCRKAGKNSDAEQYFEQSRIDGGAGGNDQDNLRSLLELVQAYYVQERWAEVETLLVESILGEQELSWPDDPSAAAVLHNRGELFRAQGRFMDAERCFKQALDLRMRLLGAADHDTAGSAMSLATMYLSQNRCADAEPALKCALKVRVRAFGVENPAVAACIETYAALLKRTKRGALAFKLEARARDIRARLVASAERGTPGASGQAQ